MLNTDHKDVYSSYCLHDMCDDLIFFLWITSSIPRLKIYKIVVFFYIVVTSDVNKNATFWGVLG